MPSARRSLWRLPPPAPATWPVRFFTNHESRNTNHGFYVFHESRVTALPSWFPTHDFPPFPGLSQVPPRKSSVPAHSGSRAGGFMDASSRRASASGLHVPPGGEAKYLPAARQASGSRNHGLACSSESRITKRGRYGSPAVRDVSLERTKPPPMVFTKHETRLFCFSRVTAFTAVRVAVSAQGSQHQKAPPGSPRPPPSHGFPVHGCLTFLDIFSPEQVFKRRNPTKVHRIPDLPETHAAQRSPRLPSPSGLLPLGPTKMNPCRERGTLSIALTVRSRFIDTSSIAVIPLKFSF